MKFGLFFFASGHDTDDQYTLLLDAARVADSMGLEAVWTPERHFHEFGAPFANPAVTGAAVAAVTSTVKVRAGSVVLPLHDNLRVAEDWAMVDRLSKGRAGIAIASGWNPRDFVLAPDKFDDRRSGLADSVAELRALWRGAAASRRSPAGTVSVRTYPTPHQSEPELWLTAAGTPATFALAGELGCGVLTHLLDQDYETLEGHLATYGEALVHGGHDPAREHVVLMMHTLVRAETRDADALAKPALKAYMRTSMNLFAVSPRDTQALASMREEDAEELLELSYSRFVREKCLVGSVEDCVAAVGRVGALGVDEIACLIDFGVAKDAVIDSLRFVGELQERCRDI